MSVRVHEQDFDVSVELAAMRRGNPKIGAIASFVGVVRDINEGSSVATMTLEHYPGMTEKALSEIVQQARSRWDVLAWRVIHRVGELHAGDQIVYVGIASTHRGDAFAAAEFIMDYLKTRAPFWKKQRTEAESQWIESRSADEQARARWDKR